MRQASSLVVREFPAAFETIPTAPRHALVGALQLLTARDIASAVPGATDDVLQALRNACGGERWSEVTPLVPTRRRSVQDVNAVREAICVALTDPARKLLAHDQASD
jgi:hypothetical protein